jgi:hypothetical protein
MSSETTPKAKRAPRVTENADFVAMMQRQIRALETRAADDPAMLAQVIMLSQRLNEVANVVIAKSASTYKINPFKAPSMMEIARMLGMTKQSASDRRKIGDRILADRMAEAAGLGTFADAKRERAARERAAEHAAATMPEYLTRRHAQV